MTTVKLTTEDFKTKVLDYTTQEEWNYQGTLPAIIDFYADWCVSCKEMEDQTFTDPAVQAELSRAVLLQADVTANDDEDQALLVLPLVLQGRGCGGGSASGRLGRWYAAGGEIPDRLPDRCRRDTAPGFSCP